MVDFSCCHENNFETADGRIKNNSIRECANPAKRPMKATSQYTAKLKAVKRSEKQEVSSREN
jgi:hypothetical protein